MKDQKYKNLVRVRTRAPSVRYNHVIHLVTAARGAEEHYTRCNNNARTEDLAAAVSKR